MSKAPARPAIAAAALRDLRAFAASLQDARSGRPTSLTRAEAAAPASRNASESVSIVRPFKPVKPQTCLFAGNSKPERGLEPMTYRLQGDASVRLKTARFACKIAC
jgi:hypothetical protein